MLDHFYSFEQIYLLLHWLLQFGIRCMIAYMTAIQARGIPTARRVVSHSEYSFMIVYVITHWGARVN
jgi:hypothetical protein